MVTFSTKSLILKLIKSKALAAFIIFLLIPTACYAGFLLMQYEIDKLNQLGVPIDSMFIKSVKYYEQGQYDSATICLKQSDLTIVLNDMLINKIFEEPSDSVYAFWDAARIPFDNYIPSLTLQTNDTSLCEYTYDATLISKGFLLNTLVTKSDSYEKTRQLYKSLSNAATIDNYRNLDNNAVNPIDSDSDNVDKTTRKREEQHLYLLAENIDKRWHYNKWPKWRDVQDSLDSLDIAVEFILIHESPDPIYAAIVLTRSKRPRIVFIGSESSVSTLKIDDIFENDKCYKKIWAPILEGIDFPSRIYFSAIGTLHKLPIEYALNESGAISNSCKITRLSHTGILAQTRYYNMDSIRYCLFGDIDYNHADITPVNVGDNNRRQSSSHDLQNSYRGTGMFFDSLPGTKHEIDSIETICQDCNINYSSFRGCHATKEALKKENYKNTNVLHIATHGFDLGHHINDNNPSHCKYEWILSLFNSGLAMAGANNEITPSVERGLLTAYEISQMMLNDVDLVVLSSCNSGGGIILQNSVWGLQQGFKMAGVNSILMTLWDVDDAATSLFMTYFYRYYTNGLTKYESLRSAQQELRNYNNGQYAKPKYWAGFILLDGLEENHFPVANFNFSE